MKDWKKAVLWALVGFCMISAVVGVFNIVSFLQMETLDITTLYVEETRPFYLSVTSISLLCAMTCIAFVIVTVVFFAKNAEGAKKKLINGFLIAVVTASAFFIVFAFCTQFVLSVEDFNAFNEYNEMYYSDFVNYQSYLSAMLSTFLPLLIAGGILLGYMRYLFKTKNSEATEKAEEGVQE